LLLINPADRVSLDKDGGWTDYRELRENKFFKNIDFKNIIKGKKGYKDLK